jgi:hypothetical protein
VKNLVKSFYLKFNMPWVTAKGIAMCEVELKGPQTLNLVA